MGDVIKLGELSKGRQSEWVDRLFGRFSAMYGARFADMWGGVELSVVKAVWADDLSAMTTDEIARGVAACKQAKFPPTLPEFVSMCRPQIDAESAFNEAVNEMSRRDQGGDVWSHPAIYWAAVTIGAFDLRNAAWSSIKTRWSRVFQAEMAKGEWPSVPARAIALPAPGATTANPEKVAAIARSATKSMEVGNKDWMTKIEGRVAAGECVPYLVQKMVEEALGRPLLRGGKHAYRPDTKDLQAGDMHEERHEDQIEERVAI